MQPTLASLGSYVIVLSLAWPSSALARAQEPAPAKPQPAPAKSDPAAPKADTPAQDPPAPRPAQQPPRAGGGGAPPSKDAFKYGSPPSLPEGQTQEQMWPAATAEGWAKPCLIPWQRSFDDALKVAKATGAPILVCVNMDGEIASEHFAGVRYRDPETAKLFSQYVCVVASVYRHMPRDYDEQGRRVLCPRFGTVTCGEHIAAETELYAKYFKGARVSPRHIALDVDGTEMYDVYYSWDTATVFTAAKAGVENRPPPITLARDGMSMPDRTASADAIDRAAVEDAYKNGDHAARVAILQATIRNRAVDQNDLLRLAVFGFDVELAKIARQSLAQNQTEAAVDLIAEALKVPLEKEERDSLVAAAERLGEKFPRGRTLAALYKGLSMNSSWIDATSASTEAASAAEYAASVERRADTAQAQPQDPKAKLEFAESLLARAQESNADVRTRKLWLEDARENALAAQKLGLVDWRTDATLAAVADQLGDADKARELAVKAVEGGMWSAANSSVRATDAVNVRVLALFAQARQQGIRKAYRENTKWPPEWLADVNAAYTTLAAHPLVTDENLVSYYDFLRWLGGTAKANTVLDDALQRFPDSPLLHDRLRSRLVWESGPAGLERRYAKMLEEITASKQLTWFAGYASLVAAEHFRRRNQFDEAAAAYDRGIAYYERNIAAVPEGRDMCDHFVALAHAGRSRLALERGELETATRELLAALERRPNSAATPDGLNITPVETAKMLQERLAVAQNDALGKQLQAALDTLDPRLLEDRTGDSPAAPRTNRRPATAPPAQRPTGG